MKLAIRRTDIFSLKFVAVRREVQCDFFYVACVHLGHELAVAGLVLSRLGPIRGDQLPEHDAQEDDADPEENCFCRRTGVQFALTYSLTEKRIALLTSFYVCRLSRRLTPLPRKAAGDCAPYHWRRPGRSQPIYP